LKAFQPNDIWSTFDVWPIASLPLRPSCDPKDWQKGFINRHEQLDQSASFSSSELLGVELQDAFPVWHGKRSSAAAQGAVQTPRTQCKHGANALTARSNSTKVQHENVQSTPQSMTSKYFHSL